MDPSTMMQRIGGHWAGEDLQREFQQEVAALLSRRRPQQFPGAQPVSFSRKHISELKKEDYFVCEKTDGLRYLMYLTQDGPNDIHYLIDRKNEYHYVPKLHFPHHEDSTFKRFHTGTILDGELVEDKYPDGSSVIKYLVFDCLVIDNNVLMQRSLDKRLGYFKSHVLKPYQAYHKAFPDVYRPFIVEDKHIEFSYALHKMIYEVIPEVKKRHGNDGLIFTCKNTPYTPGTDQHILKWKPQAENSIDFLLHITWPTIDAEPDDPDQSPQPDYLAFPEDFGLYIFHGRDEYERCGTLRVTPQQWEHFKSLNRPIQDTIVECVPVRPEDEQERASAGPGNLRNWLFHRFRDDKTDGNFVTVYDSVMESIENEVNEEELLNHSDEIRSAWKARDARARENRGK